MAGKRNMPSGWTVIDGKLDALSASVDRRFEQVDRRFEQVDRRLDGMEQRLGHVDERLERMDRRFDGVDQQFAAVDRRFDEVTAALVEQRQYTEFAYQRLETRMQSGFNRLERKIDQVIEVLIPARSSRSRRK